MQLQTTMTQLGNSDAVIIPAPIIREAKYKRGQKFTIDYVSQTNSVFIRPVQKARTETKKIDKEFQIWLDGFLTEDVALLDELAHR